MLVKERLEDVLAPKDKKDIYQTLVDKFLGKFFMDRQSLGHFGDVVKVIQVGEFGLDEWGILTKKIHTYDKKDKNETYYVDGFESKFGEPIDLSEYIKNKEEFIKNYKLNLEEIKIKFRKDKKYLDDDS